MCIYFFLLLQQLFMYENECMTCFTHDLHSSCQSFQFHSTAVLTWNMQTHKKHPVWGSTCVLSTSYGWYFLQCAFLTRHGELSEGHSLQKRAEQLTRSVTQTYKEPHSLTVMLLCQSFVLLTNAFVSNLTERNVKNNQCGNMLMLIVCWRHVFDDVPGCGSSCGTLKPVYGGWSQLCTGRAAGERTPFAGRSTSETSSWSQWHPSRSKTHYIHVKWISSF